MGWTSLSTIMGINMGRLSTRCWNIAVVICFHSALSVSEVRHWCLAIRPGSHPKCVRWGLRSGLCAGQSSSSTPISQTISVWTSLCVRGHCHPETGKGCHKIGSTESSRMLLYAVALRFPFTETKGQSPNHYSSSTKRYSWDYALGKVAFSWHPPNPDLSVKLLDCEAWFITLENTFSLLGVQWRRSLHHCSWCFALHMVIVRLVCGCSDMDTHFMKLPTRGWPINRKGRFQVFITIGNQYFWVPIFKKYLFKKNVQLYLTRQVS